MATQQKEKKPEPKPLADPVNVQEDYLRYLFLDKATHFRDLTEEEQDFWNAARAALRR